MTNPEKPHGDQLRSEFRVVMSAVVPAYKRCLVRFYLQLFVGSLMSCLHYLSLFAYTIVVSLDWPFLVVPSVFSITIRKHTQKTQ
jgi:hypothetical protein